MKQKFIVPVLLMLIFSLAATGCNKKTEEGSDKEQNKTEKKMDGKELAKNASYIIGYDLGNRFTTQNFDISIDDYIKGLKDGIKQSENRFTEDEIQNIMMEFQTYMMEKQKIAAEERKKEGEDFLAKNKDKKGVITLDSGLQYEVIKEGSGEKPSLESVVKTHYKGTLIDGTEFDSSYKRNEPAVFPVNGVIPGWTEALQLMPVGSKWKLYVPSDLAYGPRGAGEMVPPNSVLIFEIELIEIQMPEKQQ